MALCGHLFVCGGPCLVCGERLAAAFAVGGSYEVALCGALSRQPAVW